MRHEPKVLQAIRAVRLRLAAGEVTAEEADQLISQIRLDHYTRVLTALENLDHETASPEPGTRVGTFTQVGVRLTGTRHDVGAALALLNQVTDLDSISDPYPHAGEHIRIYATISRRTGLMGGIK